MSDANPSSHKPFPDVVEQYDPVELDRTGEKGIAKGMVTEIIQSIAGPEPYEDGTRPRRIHSRRVRVHLSPGIELETISRIVLAFEHLNLLVSAKEDARFTDGVNLRALTVRRKAYTENHYPDRSPWWDSAGIEPDETEVVSDD